MIATLEPDEHPVKRLTKENDLERTTGIEPAFSAWEMAPSGHFRLR
jgi:hypothetical protein